MHRDHIIKAINNILIINNYKQNELDKYWKKAVKNEILQMPDGIAKRGAMKELEALIQSFENEINLYSKLEDELLNNLVDFIIEWNTSSDNNKKLLLKPLNNIANQNNVSFGMYATFDDMELICIDVIYEIITTQILLNQYNKRFMQNNRDKKPLIENLNKSIKIAQQYSNYSLINEINTMIEQIESESYITENMIYKSCFWKLHQILKRSFSKTTNAKALANDIMSDFFNLGIQYTPTNNEAKKDFYENGFFEPRTFYYYKS